MKRWAWLILALLLVPTAWAVKVANINMVDVPLAVQSNAELQAVLPQALGEVLIKVSGNASVATLPQVQNASSSAKELLRSFSYHYRTLNDGKRQLYARVEFDHKGLVALLQQTGQAVWSSNRPLLLLWLTVKTDADEVGNVLSSDSDSVLANDVHQVMARRGIPFLLPAMDLTDQNYINTDFTQNFDGNKLEEVADRYHAKVVLGGNLMAKASGGFKSQWMLVLNGTPFSWNVSGVSEQVVVNKALRQAINMMANQFAVIDNSNLQTQVTLEVMNIANLHDYARVLAVLKHLRPVASVKVNELTPNGLLVQIATAGGQQELMQALNANRHFAVIPTPLSQGSDRADLYYRWQTTTQSGNG